MLLTGGVINATGIRLTEILVNNVLMYVLVETGPRAVFLRGHKWWAFNCVTQLHIFCGFFFNSLLTFDLCFLKSPTYIFVYLY